MPDDHHSHTATVLQELTSHFGEEAEKIVPWFLANMPEYYFRTHTIDDQARHLHAIVSGQVTTHNQTVALKNATTGQVTYLSPGDEAADLLETLRHHSRTDIDVSNAYTTKDKTLRLHTILLAPQPRANPESPAFAQAEATMRDTGLVAPDDAEAFRAFLAGTSDAYVRHFDPDRAARHFRLARALLCRPCCEDVLVELEEANPEESRIMLAMTTPPHSGLIYQIAKILMRAGLRITRAYTDHLQPPGQTDYSLLTFYAQQDNRAIAPDSALWARIHAELRLVKWFENHALESFADKERWPLRKVMLLMAACEFCHQFLVKDNPWAFTSENITRTVQANRDATAKCMDYFEARFDPRRGGAADSATADCERAALDAVAQIEDNTARQLFRCMLAFIRHTLRTNYYLDDIYGLGFRVDTAFLGDPDSGLPQTAAPDAETPYGFFFFHGPLMQGFHVRYRDMARGGMRVVPTRSQEHFEMESNRLFDEVTGLALAQQYKNKDIPEGGSKAVLLLGPHGDVSLAVKSAVNSLLDLVLPGEKDFSLPGVVDYIGREEIIYLGPDENIEPSHIEWIVQRARIRHYRWPDAFMSSKPGAGINHKEYGVTSLGVIVFVDEVLRMLGINPKTTPFTVKLTGGPRGDVAGNAMRLLMRDYGANARIVAVSDGHGAAYDPDGLDHAELLRLVDAELGIAAFDPAALHGAHACVMSAQTPEGAKLRNTLHNTARADIFIPSGGRPNTIHERNWSQFLDADGVPTAKAIVEGANIFISPLARARLQEKGVLILHGSSANKTGVICSSYEILGGLVMNETEFLAIKGQYVTEVLHILRQRARAEARVLLREYVGSGGKRPLTDLTMELSKEINRASDALYAALAEKGGNVCDDPALREMVHAYCPPVLVARYGDRIPSRVPKRHLNALVSAYVASRIVYAEGLGWLSWITTVRSLDTVVRAYLEQEKTLALYAADVRASNVGHNAEIARILEDSGRKLLTKEALGLK
ncbi:MAG: NAD-glutamate dehydrogenase domain-containing protein [Desulfovibrionaceae bacterium]